MANSPRAAERSFLEAATSVIHSTNLCRLVKTSSEPAESSLELDGVHIKSDHIVRFN